MRKKGGWGIFAQATVNEVAALVSSSPLAVNARTLQPLNGRRVRPCVLQACKCECVAMCLRVSSHSAPACMQPFNIRCVHTHRHPRACTCVHVCRRAFVHARVRIHGPARSSAVQGGRRMCRSGATPSTASLGRLWPKCVPSAVHRAPYACAHLCECMRMHARC